MSGTKQVDMGPYFGRGSWLSGQFAHDVIITHVYFDRSDGSREVICDYRKTEQQGKLLYEHDAIRLNITYRP